MSEINYTNFLGIPALTSAAPLDFMKGNAESASYVLTAPQRLYLKGRGIPVDGGVVLPKQVHGDVVWCVTLKDVLKAGVFEADAVVTDVKGLPIAIRTADCLPALLYAPQKRVIAAVHAGWKSTRLLIVQKTIAMMRSKYGVDSKDIRAAIGPCIRSASCEVGKEFLEYFPQETFLTDAGLRFDIVKANIRQMIEAGLDLKNIFDCGFDTYTDRFRFHSFRRDADLSGRMLSVIVMPS